MISRLEKIQDVELHAYVDNQLTRSRRLQIEQWLDENPVDAKRVSDWTRQNEAIVRHYTQYKFTPIPENLEPLRFLKRDLSFFRNLTASLIVALSSATIGWYSNELYSLKDTTNEDLIRPAIAAHQLYTHEIRHPVEVRADEEQHLVKWLSKRLDYELRIPRMESLGFTLIGGRLLSVDQGPAAQFMYENASGQRLTLFASQNYGNHQTSFQFAKSKNTLLFHWTDQKIVYAILGDIEREDLLRISRAVYNQLSNTGPYGSKNRSRS